MKQTIALTAIGRDRPGIVAAVSRILFEHGCNIEDSSMTILRGEFAMILIILIPDRRGAGRLESAFRAMARRMKLFMSLEELPPAPRARPGRRMGSCIISVLGSDRPGIVYRVSTLLAGRGANITDLNTRLIGTEKNPVYAMVIEARTPPRLDSGRLGADLKKLARKMQVEITLKPLDVAEL